jgi:heme/copper-type cytochrome/quinol oxidase subunit 2
MPAEDTVFYVLYDKFMFWSILVAIFTFGWLFTAILRYRDGVEPDTTKLDHIEVGAFPVDRHNTKLELAFYILPTILVVWLTVMALGSNSAVWNYDDTDQETFPITINAYQWYFEFVYEESLTWEDSDTGIDVIWDSATKTMQVTADGNSAASSIEVKLGSLESELFFNGTSIRALTNTEYSQFQHNYVKVYDADGALLHTWEHIPVNHKLITPSNPMIVPCDEVVIASMHSKPVDASDTRNVGVQHAFWVPEWGMKEDFVPGLESGTTLGFMPDDAGTFPIRCAEYCGLQHSVMTGEVMVVAPEGKSCADVDSGVKKSGSSSADNYNGGEM